MDPFALPPVAALLDAGHSLALLLGDLLAPFAGGSSVAAAVAVLTVAVRIVLLPAAIAQIRGELARRRLAPTIAELRRRHGADRERLARETLAAYRTERIPPAAGLVPLLAQAPVIALVYALFTRPVVAGHANLLLAETLAGVPLGQTLAAAVAASSPVATLAVFAAVILSLVITGLLSRRVMLRRAESSGDTTAATRRVLAVVGWTPLLTAGVAVVVPLAAAVYLATSAAWTLGERAVLVRRLS
jgi:YidC/Oxa1 family membrane protein insertase